MFVAWRTLKRATHLLFVLLQLLVQLLAFALAVLILLTHFDVLQIKLGELLLLALDVLVQLVLFSVRKKKQNKNFGT